MNDLWSHNTASVSAEVQWDVDEDREELNTSCTELIKLTHISAFLTVVGLNVVYLSCTSSQTLLSM